MIEQQTSNTIALLSQLASEASLQEDFLKESAIAQTNIDEALKALINNEDVLALSKALKVDTLIKCEIVRSPDEDDDEEQEQPDSTEEKNLATG
ncbi:hypothetical protein [Litorilituus lipolyticus]|uniref:Uncharacterized protein n=1 Tax=Litorilituus lipolyticus TaxID=2491017 RepID=A0A502KYA1_9GAMM|nr:hypothetical protein [Litorilituus lipolyticus]TPH14643.1 hypothetical protein EPA86_11125 [Litorilituus lipolyticus]